VEDVLLIDDDVELCSMLTEYLGKNDFRVKTAHRGDLGLRAAQQRPWALILLDVMLPGMDGFEVLKRIRAESSVNVLLLTARGEDVDRIVGLEIGVGDLELATAARRVLRAGARVELTDVEFSLLEALMQSPGKVVSREDLSQSVLRRPFDPFDRSLDMHVSRLRRKLSQSGSDENQVKTIRGAGYQLVVDRDAIEAGD
jgi:DNA-binding response OmpR family regulator